MKVALDFHAIDACGDAREARDASVAQGRGAYADAGGAVASARRSRKRVFRSPPAVRHESLGGAA
jgi:hypothetical protein